MDVIESLQRKTVEETEEEETTRDGMDEKAADAIGAEEDKESCEILDVSEETDGMNEEKADAVNDMETGNEGSETQAVSDPLVDSKLEKFNDKEKKTSPTLTPKKSADGMNGEMESGTLNADEVKEENTENDELQTSSIDSTPKRSNKRKKADGVSNSPLFSSGVRTRSMKRPKMAPASAPNDSTSITLLVQSDDDDFE